MMQIQQFTVGLLNVSMENQMIQYCGFLTHQQLSDLKKKKLLQNST